MAVLTKDQVARAGANVVLKVVVVRAFVAATLRVAVVNRAFKKHILISKSVGRERDTYQKSKL